jgi:hypothetical protein
MTAAARWAGLVQLQVQRRVPAVADPEDPFLRAGTAARSPAPSHRDSPVQQGCETPTALHQRLFHILQLQGMTLARMKVRDLGHRRVSLLPQDHQDADAD